MAATRQDGLAFRYIYSVQQKEPDYPVKTARYSFLSPYYTWQDCYLPAEVQLTETIREEFAVYFPKNPHVDYFTLQTSLHWRGWLQCIKPSYRGPLEKTVLDSFTLPNREERNTQLFPLWEWGNKLAMKIANWQYRRYNQQNPALMNDPTMRSLEELKDWAFNDLALVECQPEVLKSIEPRRSYVKQLVQLIPQYGLDRYYMHKLQDDLEEARTIISRCIANKDLPALLSDAITSLRELEKLVVGCLNLLHINEEVDPNYSPFNLGEQSHALNSPVERLFRDARALVNGAVNTVGFFLEVKLGADGTQVLSPKKSLLNRVNFNSAMSEEDKNHYFSVLTSLDFLTLVRKNLEALKPSQTDFGTYISAYGLFQEVTPLVENQVQLIGKIKIHLTHLLRSAHEQKGALLKKVRPGEEHFLENYHTLERNYARGTTLDNRLERLSDMSLLKMHEYKTRMLRLIEDLRNQNAQKSFDKQLAGLRNEFHHLNHCLHAFIHNEAVDLRALATVDVPQEVCLLPDAPLSPLEPFYEVAYDALETRMDWNLGEKIHLLRFYHEGCEVGALEVIRHPYLCRLPATGALNIHKAHGALLDMELNKAFHIDTECDAKEPGLFTQTLESVLHAGVAGAARGVNRVIADKMAANHFSSRWGYAIYPVVQYGSVFAFKYHCYQRALQEEPDAVRTLHALQLAAFETVKLGAIDVGVTMLNWFSTRLEKAAHPKIAQGLRGVSSVLRYGLFALAAVNQGLAPTAAGAAAGVVAEQAVTRIGKLI